MMKTPIALFFLAIAMVNLRAETFTTTDGEQISGEVKRVEPDGIVLITDSGIHKVKFKELPSDVSQKYGYDPAKAQQFQAQQTALKIASQQERAAVEASAQIKKNWEEKKAQCEKMTVWGLRNEFHGSLVFPSVRIGGGVIGDSFSSVGGGGHAVVFEGEEAPDGTKLLYVENLKNVPQGSSKKIQAYRDGSITFGDTTYEKWVWMPENL